jgi:hypothetical protein
MVVGAVLENIVVVARWLCVGRGRFDALVVVVMTDLNKKYWTTVVYANHTIFYENHHIRIHFEKYLTCDLRQCTFFKEYFTKSVGPGQFSAE